MRALTSIPVIATIAAAGLATATNALEASGDFDGDGRADRAELRRDGDVQRVVVELAARPGETMVVHEFAVERVRGDLLELKTLPSGVYTTTSAGPGDPEPEGVEVRNDALGFGVPEGAQAMAYWTGDGFRTVWLSD